MKEVTVDLPIAGTISVVVEVEDEADAIEAALNSDVSVAEIEEFEVYDKLLSGGVWYGTLTEAQIVNVYDLDDDDS
jgi:hypothetical protein